MFYLYVLMCELKHSNIYRKVEKNKHEDCIGY
jgi:hypothetical protein